MAAKMAPPEIIMTISRFNTLGINSPFTALSDLPATPGPDTDPRDPSKRQHTYQDALEKGVKTPAQDVNKGHVRRCKR
jgi:hypothetical protein